MTTPRHICMLTPTAILFDSRIQKEAISLRDAGYKVTILSIEDQALYASLEQPDETIRAYEEHMAGIRSLRYMLATRTWKWMPRKINKLFQAAEFFLTFFFGVLKQKADVYHCHDLTPAFFCWLGKLVYGARIVYDAHELEVEMFSTGDLSRKFLTWYERKQVRKSGLVITVNESIQAIMQERYGKPVIVVQNRPNRPAEEPERTGILRSTLQLSPDVNVMLYVGFLAYDRGLDMLVRSLAYLDEKVHLVIMGTGRLDEFKAHTTEEVKAANVNPQRVHFIGPFPPHEVIQYLQEADISPMLYQRSSNNAVVNSPNKLYQSILAQVPIIASANETFPAIVEPSDEKRIGICVDESDPKAIAHGIAYLLRPDIQELCRHNLKEASRSVSWEEEAKKLMHGYSQMLATRK